MKYFILTAFILSFYACSTKQSKTENNQIDSTQTEIVPADSQLIAMSKSILNAFQQKDYKSVAEYISLDLGLRFSPYAFIDTIHDQHFSRSEFLSSIDNKALIEWGKYDGSGEPIEMTFKDYFSRFVVDIDFVKLGEVTVNEFSQRGNTINNIKEAYPGCFYVDYLIKGIDPQFDGMDWKAIRLVFKPINGKIWLIGIVHDEWTI